MGNAGYFARCYVRLKPTNNPVPVPVQASCEDLFLASSQNCDKQVVPFKVH